MKINLFAFLTVYFLVRSVGSFAQGFCGTTGGFSVTPGAGCAPLTVVVKNEVSAARNVQYAYRFNRQQTAFPVGNEITADSSYTYTASGTYTILQFGSAGGTGFSLCKDVVVYETRGPRADLVACPNGSVRLTIVPDSVAKAYDQIEINWGDGTPLTIWKNGDALLVTHQFPANRPVPGVTLRGKYNSGQCQPNLNTTTLSARAAPSLAKIRINSIEMLADGKARLLYEGIEGVKTTVFVDKGNGQFTSTGKTGTSGGAQSVTVDNLDATQLYRFRLVSIDICDNPIESDIVSSLVVEEGTFKLDEIISLTWKHLGNTAGVVQYQLLRDDKVVFTSADQLSYLDNDVRCGIKYKYEIVAVIENDVRSYSASISLEPQSSAPETIKKANVTVQAPDLIATSVEVGGVGLTNKYDIVIERANQGSADYQRISPVGNERLTYEDRGVNANQTSYCYRFSYKNACNLSAPSFSEPVCSILLKSNIQSVEWTGNSPFTSGVLSYALVQLDAGGSVTDEIPKQLELKHELDLNTQAAFSFKVKASSADGNLTSYSNIVDIRRNVIVLIPGAFTPNGDGVNERFEVQSYFTTSFQLKIYNRWGSIVFSTNDPNEGWDGNIKGSPADAGQYIFKIDIIDRSENRLQREGSVLLIR